MFLFSVDSMTLQYQLRYNFTFAVRITDMMVSSVTQYVATHSQGYSDFLYKVLLSLMPLSGKPFYEPPAISSHISPKLSCNCIEEKTSFVLEHSQR